MSQVSSAVLRAVAWWVCVLLAGCSTTSTGRHERSGRYEQTVDSATNACLRNPACYTQVGDDAVLPWLSRAASGARTVVATLRFLEAAELAQVEEILVDCAKRANLEVNERMLGEGKRPTREWCEKEVRRDARNNVVTWAMEMGSAKHEVALECARARLSERFPGSFSVEPRYFPDARTRQLRLLEPDEVRQWLADGLFHLLAGTLVPDVVIHAQGDPLKTQTAYDFKFPCANPSEPSWSPYPRGGPHSTQDQGDAYLRLLMLQIKPARVSPRWGISR
ncbi:hypothetical protein HUA78_04095 [Myxococcus sp. CA033]|uniref:hypothetical protein n=1 Tax=Myxococcus sp. CA033 TaxID=2741516 RepID=UPI00157A9A5C|nr:hypothetical protein [Myxococcus sp. CA033]NTX33609.1 hypothetical protein [Myxococcus sp. CA033]